MEQSLTQTNGRITINVDVSVKKNIYAKKDFGILLLVAVKMGNI